MISEKKTRRTNIIFDVVIVGGCITGVTAAYLLQRMGLNTIIVEFNEIGFFTSGSYITHVNRFYESVYFDVLKKLNREERIIYNNAGIEGVSLIKKLIKEHRIDCELEQLDGFLFAKNNIESDDLRNEKDILTDIDKRFPRNKKFPYKMPNKTNLYVGEELIINNLKYMAALRKLFLEAGGSVQEMARVLKVDNNSIKTVYTTKGKVKGKHLVYTPQTSRVINLKPYSFFPYVYYSVSGELESGTHTPGVVYDMENPSHRYIITNGTPDKVVISGEDHKNVKGKVRKEYFDRLMAILKKNFKVRNTIANWSYVYYKNVDGLPVIGRTNEANTYIAAGYKPDGMVLAAVAAKSIFDLITTGESKYEFNNR